MINRIGILVMLSVIGVAIAGETPAPSDARVYIISPQNGEVVSSPFKVKFGLSGMGVAPAGIDKKNTGHHHLLVDGKSLPDMTKAMGKQVKHFGGGQTETTLMLDPGQHTLQLILGDKKHIPHQRPVISKEITIHVK